jgi:predicted enzyme related to lactoylglutathione lyase
VWRLSVVGSTVSAMTTRDSAWPDGTPCWIDLMTTDAEAARSFYGELFGWQFQIGGEETGFYALASLEDKNVAGVGSMQMEHPPVWTTYLATADADASSDEAVRAGGTLIAPAMDVMDFGRMAIVQDPTSGTFGLWQAGTHIGTGLVNEPGALLWNELMTRDYDGSKEFYAAVFSYTYTEIGDGAFSYSTIEVDGHVVGGLGKLPDEVPAQVPPHWRTYFAVDDADATVDKAVAFGGSVVRPASDMPYGRYADLSDPQGAMFSVIKPTPPA